MIPDTLWYVEACLIAVNDMVRRVPNSQGLLTAQAYWVARWNRIVEAMP